jgi:hypothetical protein
MVLFALVWNGRSVIIYMYSVLTMFALYTYCTCRDSRNASRCHRFVIC